MYLDTGAIFCESKGVNLKEFFFKLQAIWAEGYGIYLSIPPLEIWR